MPDTVWRRSGLNGHSCHIPDLKGIIDSHVLAFNMLFARGFFNSFIYQVEEVPLYSWFIERFTIYAHTPINIIELCQIFFSLPIPGF